MDDKPFALIKKELIFQRIAICQLFREFREGSMSLFAPKLVRVGGNLAYFAIARHIMDHKITLDSVKSCVWPLSAERHKGQAGRIGIVGGSIEYTGAPYFAGIGGLKVGADLVHIFCASAAAPVIKSYSPELIVHPLLDQAGGADKIEPWLNRLQVLVIGPGLGRDPNIFETVSKIVNMARIKSIPLVIDADGLFLVTENLDLIKDYPAPGVILTPNLMEYKRFNEKIHDKGINFKELGNHITIMSKGKCDKLVNTQAKFEWDSCIGGSNRRCGGQGDLLSGSIATLLHWALVAEHEPLLAASIACYGASRLIRLCNEKAFKVKGRSMLAGDMLEYIHESFEELYE